MKKSELIEKYKKILRIKNYAEQTEKSYLSYLKLFLDYITLPENKIKPDEQKILDYLHYCKNEKKYSYSTMKQAVASVKFLYQEVLCKKVDFNFHFKMKKPDNLPNVLSPAEVKKIIDNINNLKHKTIISNIYSCGLRLSEVINLRISDVDSDLMLIKVVQSKGKKDRYVMLSEKLLDMLRDYFQQYKPKKYLFEGVAENQYSTRSVQNIFRTTLKKSGILKKATVHTLRHSFATHLLDTGTDIRYIQELLGHKNLATTQIYTHINPPSIKKIKSPFDLI